MSILLILLMGGLAVMTMIVTARRWDAAQWRRELRAYRLRLPAGLAAGDIAAWLTAVVAGGGSRSRLLDAPPLGLETVATSRGIESFVVVPESRRVAVLASLRAALPGARIEEVPDYLKDRARLEAAGELRLSSWRRPLAVERAEATVAAYLSAQQPLTRGEVVRTQWLLTNCVRPIPGSGRDAAEVWAVRAGSNGRNPEAEAAERQKLAEPLVRAVGRIGVAAPTTRQATALLHRTMGTLRIMDAPGVVIRRRVWPGRWTAEDLTRRAVPIVAWPLVLNVREAAGLVGLPVGEPHLLGVTRGAARQLPPAPSMPSRGAVVAVSNFPGLADRPLALLPADRLRHIWIDGPTGVGKSTLMGNLIVQDMVRGDGLMVVDSRGDLIPDLLARVPEGRRDDVMVLDPAQVERPVGFNVLAAGLSRELAVDHVLHVLHDLYRASWGPRTADVLRAGLLTLTHAQARDGSTFTLVELAELLTNVRFRQFVTTQPQLPAGLGSFWRWFAELSDGERANVIGPVLNKIRAFGLQRSLRFLLGQSSGLDLSRIFTERKILLVPLSRGTLGAETAHLIGSLLVASLWQATLGRVNIPADWRRPAWLHIDEFQETVRLPIDLADMLAQARGLGLGLVLGHQHLGQLPEAMKRAVLGTARTQIVFQCDYDDASTLARSFGPLTRDDLMGLERFEIAMRPSVAGRTLSPVTGTTLPWPEPTSDAAELARASRERWGVPAAEVEAALAARVGAVVPLTSRRGRVVKEVSS